MSCVVPPKVKRKTQITTKVPWFLPNTKVVLRAQTGDSEVAKIILFEVEKNIET